MLIRVISSYLRTNKRLIVPQLGAFLVKEPTREVLFSELIRRDDGVLRGLLVAEGMSELAAQGEIDRFVFEVRHAVEEGRTYIMEGFGQFSPNSNATIGFRRIASIAQPEKAPIEGDEAARQRTAARNRTAEKQMEAAPAQESADDSNVRRNADPATDVASTDEISGASEQRAAASAEEPTEQIHEHTADSQDEHSGEQHKHPARRHLTESVKMNPAPYVRGLSYGKPPKNTDAFTYVDRPQRRGRIDNFMLVAIVAVVIALGAIAFGFYHNWQERRAEEASIRQLEAVLSGDAESTDAAAVEDATESTEGKE